MGKLSVVINVLQVSFFQFLRETVSLVNYYIVSIYGSSVLKGWP